MHSVTSLIYTKLEDNCSLQFVWGFNNLLLPALALLYVMHCIYLLRSIGKPSSKSHWIYQEDDRVFLCQCTTAKGTIGRLNFLLSFISILPAWKGKEGISSLFSLKTVCITYQQMKWGTRQHSSRLLWHQQSLVQLFTLTMGSTQWDLHLTALLYPHEHISVRFELE